MSGTITYQMLYDKLRGFGFTEKAISRNGTTRRVFTHPDFETAILDLPDCPAQTAVAMHIGAVRTLLLRYGFISETDFVYQ